jgi:hypothetical protein
MNLEPRVREAVRYFWSTRERQAAQQGGDSGKKDAGARAAVTGGAQMDGFVRLVRDILYDSGIRQGEVKFKATHHASIARLDALFASLKHGAFRGKL